METNAWLYFSHSRKKEKQHFATLRQRLDELESADIDKHPIVGLFQRWVSMPICWLSSARDINLTFSIFSIFLSLFRVAAGTWVCRYELSLIRTCLQSYDYTMTLFSVMHQMRLTNLTFTYSDTIPTENLPWSDWRDLLQCEAFRAMG